MTSGAFLFLCISISIIFCYGAAVISIYNKRKLINSRDEKWVEDTMREYNRLQRKKHPAKTHDDEDLYLVDQGAGPIIIVDLGDGNGLGPDGDIYRIISKEKEGE
jgi:hypothetical protein